MCVALYLASPAPLPLIAWQEEHPSFYVAEVAREEEGVKGQFRFPNIYYLGSHEGCGCGFRFDDETATPDDRDERESAVESLRRLVPYLAAAVKAVPEVELFACWEG